MTVGEDIGEGPPGSTLVTPGDLAGLLPTWLATQRDLNQAEQANIERAVRWAFTGRRPVKDGGDLLTLTFSAELHKRMFGDARFWTEHRTYLVEEIAVRLHHGLVAIHPYPDGNGRQTRMLADVYLDVLGENRLSWGRGGDLIHRTDRRDEYLAAMRSADAHDIAPLLQFATR